ncbi:MAG TPA: right-handed parallel beta-helix repeat-containing protein [Burkholderiaceae bacterium]
MITRKLFQSLSFHASLLAAGALGACGGSADTAAPAASSTKLERSAKASGSVGSSSYEQAAQSLYVAYFGRPADQVGLANLEQQLAAANAPTSVTAIDRAYAGNARLKQTVDQLGSTTESARLYGMGSDSGAQLVSAVFQHVLQRAPSRSEAANWLAKLGTGGYSSTRLPLDVMAAALNGDAQSTDALAVGNRIAFATAFTQQLAQRGAKSYGSMPTLAAARTTMARIDHSASSNLQSSKVEDAIGTLDAVPARKLMESRKATVTTAFYVSPSGNNANPGTQAAPWKTLQYGVSKLTAGQTLYAMSGVYAETVAINASGTAASPITVAAYPGQTPVIDGATVVVGNYASLLKLHGNYITVSGFEVRNINNDGHGGNGGTATVLDGYGVSIEGNNDTVSNLNVHNTWAQGILASGNNALIENNTVSYVAMSNCRAANTPNCSSTSRGWASCLSAASPYGSTQITYNAVIQGNTVFNCWGEGISTWLSNGTVIQNNVTYNNWAENMYVNNAWNTLVQRNVIYNTPNTYVGAMASFSLADEQTNTVANTHSAYPTVINNLLYNSPLCAFCWTLVNGTGLYGAMIANNTVVATALPTGVSAFATGGAGNSKNVVNVYSFIYNNVVSGAGYVPSAGGLTLSNNLWSVKPTTPAAIGANDVIGQNPQLAQSGSTDAGQLTSGYFQPLATSPVIGKGKSLTTIATDFVGSAMGAPPNIGSYQTTAL